MREDCLSLNKKHFLTKWFIAFKQTKYPCRKPNILWVLAVSCRLHLFNFSCRWKYRACRKPLQKAYLLVLEQFWETVLSEHLEDEIFSLPLLFWCDVSGRVLEKQHKRWQSNQNSGRLTITTLFYFFNATHKTVKIVYCQLFHLSAVMAGVNRVLNIGSCEFSILWLVASERTVVMLIW